MTLFLSLSSFAGSASHKMTFSTTKDLELVLSHITDYENSCQTGCVNYLPSVDRITVLRNIDYADDQFYTWTFVNDFMNSKFFSKVIITRSENEMTILTEQVGKSLGKRLAKASGLKSSPLLASTSASYHLINVNGETIITYNINVKFKGLLLNAAKKQIKKGIVNSANAIRKNLLK